MRKRILVVAEYFPPRLGGDRRIFEIMQRLANRHDVHFMTVPPSYGPFIRETASNAQHTNCPSHGATIHELGLPDPIRSLFKHNFPISFILAMCYLVPQAIRKAIQIRPHIVIANNTSVYTGLIALVCAKTLWTKLLTDYNDLMANYTIDLLEGKLNRRILWLLSWGVVLVERAIIRNSWKVTTTTRFLKYHAMSQTSRDDLVLIPNGVDTHLFDPRRFRGDETRHKYGIDATTTLCLYTGRVDRCAGALLIYEVVKSVGRENLDVKFMIVGEGDPRMVNALSTSDRVILTGPVPRELVPEYLAAADIVLVPFPNTMASAAISPLKLFEALSMEKPVIASALSGIKDVLVHEFSGILVPEDSREWVSAIRRLIARPEKRIMLGKAGGTTVREKYDFDLLAREFQQVVEGR